MSRHYPAGAMPRHNASAPSQGAPLPHGVRGPAPFHQAPPARSRHSSSSYASSSSSFPSTYHSPPSPPPGAVPRDLRPRDTVPIQDLRHERRTEADARELLSTYHVIRLERVRNRNDVDAEGYPLRPSWERVHQFIQSDYPQEEARRRVAQLVKESKPVYEKKRAKDVIIQRQIELVLEDFARKELDPRYQFTLAQFESQYRRLDDHSVGSTSRRRRSHRHHHSRKSRKHSSRSRSPRKERQAIIIYLKRSPAKGENGLRMLQEEDQRKTRREMPPAPIVHMHPGVPGHPPVDPRPAPIYSAPTPHHSSPPARPAPAPHHLPPNHAVPTAPVNPMAPPMNPNMRGQPQPPMPAMSGMREGLSRPPSRAQPKQPQPDFDEESADESEDESEAEETMPTKQVNPAHPTNPGNMVPRTAPPPPLPGAVPPRPGQGNFPVNPNAAPGPRGPPPNMPANPNAVPASRGPPPNLPGNPNVTPGPRGPPPNMPASPNAAPAPRGPPNMPTNPNAAPGPRGPPNMPANLNAAAVPRGPPPTGPRPAPVPNPQVTVPPPHAPGRPAPPAQAPGVNRGMMANPQTRPSFDPHAAPEKPGVGLPEMRPPPSGQVRLQKPPVGAQVKVPRSPVSADDHIIVTTTIGGRRRKSKTYDESDRSSRASMASDDCFSADESEGTRPSSVSSDSGSRPQRRDQSSTQARKDRHEDVRVSRPSKRESDEQRPSRHVSHPRARFASPSRRGESSHRRRESPQRRGESSYHRRESPHRHREPSRRRRESPHRRREESRSPRRDYLRDNEEWAPRRRQSVVPPRVIQQNPAPRLVSVPEAKREIYADHETSRLENRLERARREEEVREREIRRDNDRLRDLGDRGFRHRRGLRSRIFDLLGDDYSHGGRDSRWREGDARDYMRRSADFDRLRPLRDSNFFRRD